MSAVENATAATGKATRDLAPNGVVIVSNLQLASLMLVLGVVLFASKRLNLGVERKLAIAAVRCMIQLSALGLVLVPIILYNYPPLVLGYMTLMMFVAAVEASVRPPYVFDAMVLVCFVSITATVAVFGTFTFTVVISIGLDAQYVIPIIGMITGQAMSAVSVAISNLVTEFAERKSNVEVLLALGANRWEASYDIVRSSVVLGLTPTLNTMSVTGLVSIPGMMTGQIIGGTPPGLAAKYQAIIMFVASGTATISTITASILTIYALIDSQHRVRDEKLHHRDTVNRIDSVVSTARYLASGLMHWRGDVRQRASPFPAYVHDPLPMTHSPETQIPITSDTDPVSHSKHRDPIRGYGSVPSSKCDEENR